MEPAKLRGAEGREQAENANKSSLYMFPVTDSVSTREVAGKKNNNPAQLPITVSLKL